jgi:SPP1 gp7 family putative phage head morphogenesis protein
VKPALAAMPPRVWAPKKRTKKALKPLRYPWGEEQVYAQELIQVAKAAAQVVTERLVSRLPQIMRRAARAMGAPPPDKERRQDSFDDELRRLLRQLGRLLRVPYGEARRIAMRMLDSVNIQHANAFAASYGDVLSLNPLLGKEKWFLDAFGIAVEENVALIQSIPEQLHSQVEVMVSEAVLSGKRAEDLALELIARFDLTEDRAALIAQDQVGKFFGSLQRLRQQDAGITEYIWSSSNDARVRASHAALEGKVIKWSEPPVVASNGRRAHAGMDFRCRCIAAPVIPSFEEGEP